MHNITILIFIVCLIATQVSAEEITLNLYHDRKEKCPNKKASEALHGKFEWAIEMPTGATLYAPGFDICNIEGKYYLKKCVPLMYVPFKVDNVKVSRINEEQYKAITYGKYGWIDCREGFGVK